MAFKIFLSPPNMCGKEREYVNEAFDTNWIAPYGPHLNAFEREMAAYVGVDSALAVTSGTAAIHLALRLYGVGPGDLVFCSDFTFAGSCNPILYQGAEPVFIDSEPYTWNMSSVALEKAFRWAKSQGKQPKAVIVVDLYGESANWDKILPVCCEYNVPVIEDAAEAVGSSYKGKKCGSFGDINILSLVGVKTDTGKHAQVKREDLRDISAYCTNDTLPKAENWLQTVSRARKSAFCQTGCFVDKG